VKKVTRAVHSGIKIDVIYFAYDENLIDYQVEATRSDASREEFPRLRLATVLMQHRHALIHTSEFSRSCWLVRVVLT